MKINQFLAQKLFAARNSEKAQQPINRQYHLDVIGAVMKETAPSGSGFDSGTTFEAEQSDSDKLVFRTFFHNMDKHGGYTRWTEHVVVARADFVFGMKIKISGSNHDGIKDYIAEVFEAWLSREVNPLDYHMPSID
jgi:hypothetical protein